MTIMLCITYLTYPIRYGCELSDDENPDYNGYGYDGGKASSGHMPRDTVAFDPELDCSD